jgi:hypothetical protein
MDVKLVGICGAIGSGKDTVANYLVKERGFKIMSFAYHLKRLIVDTLQIHEDFLFGTQEQKADPIHKLGTVSAFFERLGAPWDNRIGQPWCGRWLAELIGTEVFRNIYGPVWVERALAEVLHDRHAYHRFDTRGDRPNPHTLRHVFTDARFLNEAEGVRKAGGRIWRTIRVDEERATTGHVSDQEWRQIIPDYDVKAASGEFAKLYERADQLLGFRS